MENIPGGRGGDTGLEGSSVVLVGVGSSGEVLSNGRATALAFARVGARVALVDNSEVVLEECGAEFDELGAEHVRVLADVTSEAAVNEVVARTLGAFGRIDVLQNNVGITQYGKLTRTTPEDLDRLFSVNVKSFYLLCRAIAPLMRDQSHGVITNVSSISSVRHLGISSPLYDMSKAAVNALTRHLAVTYGPYGVRSNALLLGMMDTPLARAGIAKGSRPLEDVYAEYMKRIPSGRLGSGADCANVSVFLASPQASYLNGLELLLDGGLAVTTA